MNKGKDMNMRKILFLTDMWLPQPTANSICVKNIATLLKQRGWEVYINAFEGKPNQSSETVDGLHIEYTKPALSRQLMTKAVFATEAKKRVLGNMGIFLNRVTRIVCIPFYPIVSPIFTKRWSKQIIRQIKENGINYIVSVNAPLDSIAAGYLVKKTCSEVKWIAYYIDGGSNYGKEQAFLKLKKKLQNKSVKWENKVLSGADKIIVMEGHSKFYTNMLNTDNVSRLAVLNVPLFNTQRTQLDVSLKNSSDKEIWTYMGTIRDGFYNPSKFFSWFLKYAKTHNAELHLYGSTNMDEYLQHNCDNKRIFYHGLIPHNCVDSVLTNSDVLVYFRSEKLDSVSGKFFEYLTYHKPIVYFGPKDDINWKQLEKYPLGIAIDQDTGEQTNEFALIINSRDIISNDTLEKMFYTSTPGDFVDLVETMERKG
ncbi:MAG: hypothetical protein SPE24_05250 [Erysipelotrichaceae bacterium]|nr:hypothetical protein [Erysipelotrichaceae bacterium]